MDLQISNRQISPAVVNMFQYENQTTTLNFVLDSYMYDEVDLRNYKAYAVTSQNGLIDYTELVTRYDEVDDELTLSWTVGEYSLREDGAVLYQIVFKENADDGENSAVFYSYKAIIINRGSVDGDNHLTANYPTLLKQWLDKMNAKQVELENYVADKAAEELGRTTAELVEYINYISGSVNACVIYIPYGQTVEIADRLDSRLYYQYLDEAHSVGRFEDHLGNILSNENTGGASLPLFAFMWSDHLLNDISYLRSDTFSWQDGEVYQAGYEHLVNDIQGEPQTEIIGDVTVTYYLGVDKLKICLADQESNVQSIYDNTGVAWYYILDTENKRFKLPRETNTSKEYLYFYVGNSVRNATEIDMGALAEIVNDFDITVFQEEVNAVVEQAISDINNDSKINDLQTQIDNLKAELNTMLGRMDFANSEKINITDSTPYTVPQDGYIQPISGGDSYMIFINDVQFASSTNMKNGTISLFPVSEGDVISIDTTSGSIVAFVATFIPQKGV